LKLNSFKKGSWKPNLAKTETCIFKTRFLFRKRWLRALKTFLTCRRPINWAWQQVRLRREVLRKTLRERLTWKRCWMSWAVISLGSTRTTWTRMQTCKSGTPLIF